MIWNKRKKSAVAIYTIAAIIYTLLVAIIPFPKPAGSWLVFAFSVISFVFGVFVSLYAFSKEETLISKFYGYPVFRIGAFYTIFQITISIVIFAIGSFVNLPYWVGLSISILLLGLASIGVIATDNSKDYIEEIQKKETISTQTMTMFENDISDILDLCKSDSVREPLKKLVTKFKYSDPVSSKATEQKEKEITEELEKLKEIIKNNDVSKAIDQIEIIGNLLSSRNRVCESGK